MLKKVCYVVCYKDPNYVRTNSLVNALKDIDKIELIEVRNKHKTALRYVEVPLRLLAIRLKYHPDVFVVGFRAHEIFWALYPAMVGKRIIFDEFIDIHDWLLNEHKKTVFRLIKPLTWLVDLYMKLVMKLSYCVLTDTLAHAKLAVKNYAINPSKIIPIPVGTDETVFYPRKDQLNTREFNVFYYGTALPLHGFDVILDALNLVTKRKAGIHFTIAGGKGNPAFIKTIRTFIEKNHLQSVITHKEWVGYTDELPKFIAESNLCLGGPFGNTGQARRVIAGKTFQFLAMAKPTVVGKIEELEGFIDKKNCLLVNQGSAEELAGAILWAYDHSSELGEISKQARQLYEERFSQKIQSQRLEELVT